RDLLLAAALMVLLSLCKFNPWLALLPLLIPARKFQARWGPAAFAVACIAVASGAAFLWQYQNAAALAAFQASRAADGKLMGANAAFVAAHPVHFAGIML